MATTVNQTRLLGQGEFRILVLTLTAGGADSSVAYTVGAGVKIHGILGPVKTTGTAGAMNATYVESTGVLTITCAANDVIETGVVLD